MYMLRTNEEVKNEVLEQLRWDSRVDPKDVNIDVQDGEVTLFGSVPTQLSKQAVERDAWSVAGVSEVENALSIEYRGTQPELESLRDHIRDILHWDPHMDADQIRVALSAGRVTLRGTVDAYWKRLLAQELVQDVRGVTEVVDALTVVRPQDVRDETICTEIVDALRRNRNVDVDSVEVSVDNGQVTLTGSVPTWVARNSAYEAAVLTYGVIDVDVNIAISS